MLKKHLEKTASSSARAFLESDVLPQHRRLMAEIGCDPQGIPQPELKALPQKVDETAVMADLAELRKMNETTDPWHEIDELNEMDRYESLVELDVQGVLIPKKWQAYMKYYEMTPEYERHQEYWEEHRAKMALMYQVGG